MTTKNSLWCGEHSSSTPELLRLMSLPPEAGPWFVHQCTLLQPLTLIATSTNLYVNALNIMVQNVHQSNPLFKLAIAAISLAHYTTIGLLLSVLHHLVSSTVSSTRCCRSNATSPHTLRHPITDGHYKAAMAVGDWVRQSVRE